VLLDLDEARRAFAGRTVLVTGAAGSIGSELCNQLSQLGPNELIALDQAESELFRLEGELHGRYPGLRLSAEIGDIRDESRMVEIIENHGVDAIFHAAAYKHVPVMERQVCEATRNNVVGTWNLAQAAWRSNVSSLLMISTDKAVNPTSIMGLTKRVAELLVTASRPSAGRGTATKFVCVRFGNVLVSNGSVVPIFRKQIAAGGPVTVTHPDMRRYFMTVDEAVQLVLQASIIGKGSEIFMLDMGKPVRIVDLARKMIALAGLVPDEDIEIRMVGVRPGEKLFEELNRAGENLVPTSHAKIRIFKGRQEDMGELLPWISQLERLLRQRAADAVIAHLSSLVPEYQPLAGVTSVVERRAARSSMAPTASPAYTD
jgi:FlaA1/EpsC-like NDP-sugar epimerase